MRLFWQPIVLNDPLPTLLGSSFYTKEEILTELKNALTQIRGHHMDPETGGIDYVALKSSSQFAELEGGVGLLHQLRLSELMVSSERIALWLNVYNLLAVHAIVALGIKHSVLQIPLYFRRVQYRIGKERYSLSDIEKILGALDRRTYFAMNFGSVSCGIPRAFDEQPQLLEEELNHAVREALEGVHVHEKDQIVVLPALMGRWKHLEKGDAKVLAWIFPYLPKETQAVIARRQNYKVKYADFDFTLNVNDG